jgi:putative transposase
MKRSRFSEEQIIGILREQEAGAATADVCRKHGISNATFYIYGRLSRCKDFVELH